MLFFQRAVNFMGGAIPALLASVICFSLMLVGPAHANNTVGSQSYFAPNGVDMAVVDQCLPSELRKGDLGRALREAGNDYLQKVFRTKDNYGDNKLDQTEIEFLNCLKRNGVTPQIEQNWD